MLLFFLTLFSCMPKSTCAIETYESSASMCVDALSINLSTSGCEIVETTKLDESTVHLKCGKYSRESEWTLSDFYITRSVDQINSENIFPLCADGTLTIFFVPKHPAK